MTGRTTIALAFLLLFDAASSEAQQVGLAIARTIVDAQGGTIEARNNPEGGSTFTVTLRRVEMLKSRPGPPHAA